jgi:hypothetical protein
MLVDIKVNIKIFTPIASSATAPKSLLIFVNANREIRKRTDIIVAFTQEYFRVSYLSSEKQ